MSNLVQQHSGNANVALPTEWEARMAQYAKEGLSHERSPGQLFSTKNGILTFGGIAVPNNRMQVCVVAAMFENAYYKRPYDASNPMSPECYAFSVDGKNMVPHAAAEEPQSQKCDGCPHNEWVDNPARPGKQHKRCKELRRLAVMPAVALGSPQQVVDATVGYLRLPVTSTKPFSEYVKHVGMRGLPIFAVITDILLAPDPKTQWKFSFSSVGAISDPAVLEAVEQRHIGERVAMAFPYPKNVPQAQAPAAPQQARKF